MSRDDWVLTSEQLHISSIRKTAQHKAAEVPTSASWQSPLAFMAFMPLFPVEELSSALPVGML